VVCQHQEFKTNRQIRRNIFTIWYAKCHTSYSDAFLQSFLHTS